jgi:hypothetical protein
MLMLVLPAMADSPVNLNHSVAAGHISTPASDAAAVAGIGAQGLNLNSVTFPVIDYSTLLSSWTPAPGYETPRMEMTNTGEARMNVFAGHDLAALGAGTAVGAILYAPSEADNPTFRADVAACTGATVDYFDARAGTPTVALLSAYDCVLVWANYAFADQVSFGNNLAAYVDAGGKVILGQWCLPTAGNYLSGAIMTAAYCPVTGTFYEGGAYNNDGTDCVHGGITSYESASYFDVATLVAGAFSDGTFNNPSNSLAVAWRADRKVYYSPGNTGALYSTGQWAQLLCNMCDCSSSDVDCVCSGAYSSGDRVVATLSNPQGASGLSMGWGGTVICGAIGYPPLLIQWDDWQSGHNGNGFCVCPVDSLPDYSGWYIDCTDVTPSVNVSCACGGAYNTGDRVMALVNNPTGQPDVYAGDHGTVISGYTGSSTIILISWDGVTSGHDGNGFADCPVTVLDNTSGWWVDCTEVAPVGSSADTIDVALNASPDSGSAPFVTTFTAQLNNLTTNFRLAAGKINVTLANGNYYTNWRAGFTTLSSLENFSTSWNVTIPALGAVMGTNTFALLGEDVTPSPYNQPPYAPSGDTDTSVETVVAN